MKRKGLVFIICTLLLLIVLCGTALAEEDNSEEQALSEQFLEIVRSTSNEAMNSQTWASYGADKYLGPSIGLDRTRFVSNLESHEHDHYYLGTPYAHCDGPVQPFYANGAPGPGGFVGFNCAGWVTRAVYDGGGYISRIGQFADHHWGVCAANTWANYMVKNNLRFYEFNSKEELLASGIAQKGDIIYCLPTSWALPDADTHLCIFWGDSPSDDKMWHSVTEGNIISEMIAAIPSSYWFLFPIDRQDGYIQIFKLTDKTTSDSGYSLAGGQYTVYSDYDCTKPVGTLTTDAWGTTNKLRVVPGTYLVKETKAVPGYKLHEDVWKVKVTKNHTSSNPYYLIDTRVRREHVQNLRGQLVTIHDRLVGLQKELDSLNAKKDAYDNRALEIETQLEELKQDPEATEESIVALETELEECRKNAEDLMPRKTELEGLISDLTSQQDYIYQRIDILTKSGLYNEGGALTYYSDGFINLTFSGFASMNDENGNTVWYYVDNGKVTGSKRSICYGTINGQSGWYHVIGSRFVQDTCLDQNENGWWRVVNGKVDFGCNSVEQNQYGWWKITNGKVDFGYTGIAMNQHGWWRIVNGKVDFGCNSVEQNEHGWWYVRGGQVDFSYNGLAKNRYGWWHIKNGKVDFSSNTIVKNEYGWWKVTNGQVDFSCNSVEQNSYGWWKITNGKVDFGFNGVAANRYGTWYIRNGKVDFSYTGLYGWRRVVNGRVY